MDNTSDLSNLTNIQLNEGTNLSGLSGSSGSSSFNLNFKTIFLFVILLCACCLLSIGNKFEINKVFDMGGLSFWACLTLTLFLFYVLYEFFKSDTCADLNKSGLDRLSSTVSRGRSWVGQQGTNAATYMGNRMASMNPNPSSNGWSTQLNQWGQKQLPLQYQNQVYTNTPNPLI